MKDEFLTASSFRFYPSPFTLHPSSFILHPSRSLRLGVRTIMTAWIWETTPIHVDFDSDSYFGEIVEPVSGETWVFNLSRYAGVTIGSPDNPQTTKIPIRSDTTEAEELENGIRLILDCEGVRCVFEMILEPEAPEIVCTVREVPTSTQRVLSAVFPGPLLPKNQRRHEVLDTLHQGRLHRPVLDTDRHVKITGAGSPMAWWAQLGEKSSLLAITETHYDWDWSYSDTLRGTTVICRWISSLGALNYTRRLRYVFFPGRGYVQPARRYRRYAKETGLHVPMAPRCAQSPALDRLHGACAVFVGTIDDPGCDYLRHLETLKAAGIERAFVYPLSVCCHNEGYLLGGSPPIERSYLARDIEDHLEFVAAPGMWVENVWEKNPRFRPEITVTKPDGSSEIECQIEGERFFRLHEGYAVQMLEDLEEDYEDYLGAHFETTTACELQEHQSGPWPYSRAEEARLRCDLMALPGNRGVVISAAGQRDWSLGVRHLGSNMAGPRLGVKSPVWLVPLWHLVYHDAGFSTWRDTDAYNTPHQDNVSPRHHFLLDMLYANVPLIQPMGHHYRFTTQPHVKVYGCSLTDPEMEQSLPLAVRAAQHHRRHGLEDLVYHAILTEDGTVQESAFESGTHVVVNFGKEPYPLPGGEAIEAEGVLVD